MIPIDEQIEYQREPWGSGEHESAILASLKELAAIKSQPVPVNAKELWEECADMEAYGEAAMSYDGFKFAVSGLTPAAIKSQPVPDENGCVGFVRARAENGNKEDAMVAEYIDTMCDLLKRAQQERDDALMLANSVNTYDAVTLQRAEAAESKLAQIERMGREPSEGMMDIYRAAFISEARFDGAAVFTAMFAKMIEELK